MFSHLQTFEVALPRTTGATFAGLGFIAGGRGGAFIAGLIAAIGNASNEKIRNFSFVVGASAALLFSSACYLIAFSQANLLMAAFPTIKTWKSHFLAGPKIRDQVPFFAASLAVGLMSSAIVALG